MRVSRRKVCTNKKKGVDMYYNKIYSRKLIFRISVIRALLSY